MTAEEWEKKWGSLPQEPQEPTPVVSDQEMLRAYAATIKLKDAEIERLTRVVEAQVERLDYLEARHANEFNLLSRAADALGPYALGFPDGSDIRALITELRKATELK